MRDFEEDFDQFKKEVTKQSQQYHGNDRIYLINLEKMFGDLDNPSNLKSFQEFFLGFFGAEQDVLHMKQFMMNIPITGLFQYPQLNRPTMLKKKKSRVASISNAETTTKSSNATSSKLNRMVDYFSKIQLVYGSTLDMSA